MTAYVIVILTSAIYEQKSLFKRYKRRVNKGTKRILT
jgi:hypothetical protein